MPTLIAAPASNAGRARRGRLRKAVKERIEDIPAAPDRHVERARNLLAGERYMAVPIDRWHFCFRERFSHDEGARQMPSLGHQPGGVEIGDVVRRAEMPDAAMTRDGQPLGR